MPYEECACGRTSWYRCQLCGRWSRAHQLPLRCGPQVREDLLGRQVALFCDGTLAVAEAAVQEALEAAFKLGGWATLEGMYPVETVRPGD